MNTIPEMNTVPVTFPDNVERDIEPSSVPKDVESGNNATGVSGGGFNKELSRAEKQFDVENSDLDRFKLPDETAVLFSGIKPIGYSDKVSKFGEETPRGENLNFHHGNSWLGVRAEGVN